MTHLRNFLFSLNFDVGPLYINNGQSGKGRSSVSERLILPSEWQNHYISSLLHRLLCLVARDYCAVFSEGICYWRINIRKCWRRLWFYGKNNFQTLISKSWVCFGTCFRISILLREHCKHLHCWSIPLNSSVLCALFISLSSSPAWNS